MFRQLIAAIRDDDNPRLHRIHFLAFWIMSYGLAWLALYVYEQQWYDSSVNSFLYWLRDTPYRWAEGIFLGFIFGLVLVPIQAWLIRERYGYLPRFWRLLTFLGAIIAGYGYPRVYLASASWGGVDIIPDFFWWFTVFGIFQSIAFLSINRKAWLLGLIGLVSAGISSLLWLPSIFHAVGGLIVGTAVQTLGTGIITLYLMTNPHEGSVPKRDGQEKAKNEDWQQGMSRKSFVWLWSLVCFYIGFLVIMVGEIFYFLAALPPMNFWYALGLLNDELRWVSGAIIFGITGIIIGWMQGWLLETVSQHRIPHWWYFSVFGWIVAGALLFAVFQLNVFVSFGLAIASPFVFQAFPMSRALNRGWLWAVYGILAGLVTCLALQFRWFGSMSILVGLIVTIVGISLSSALLFLWLDVQDRAIEKPKWFPVEGSI